MFSSKEDHNSTSNNKDSGVYLQYVFEWQFELGSRLCRLFESAGTYTIYMILMNPYTLNYLNWQLIEHSLEIFSNSDQVGQLRGAHWRALEYTRVAALQRPSYWKHAPVFVLDSSYQNVTPTPHHLPLRVARFVCCS